MESLDHQIPKLMNKYHVPGISIGIIHNSKVTNIKNYGYADKRAKETIHNDTYYQVGSISKSVTAWGIMKLVEQGELDLDKPVSQYLTRWKLPETAFKREITIRQLLSHTSGIAEQNYSGYKEFEDLPTLEQSLSGEAPHVQPIKMVAEPGTEYIYSGAGFTLLQLIIEEVSGTSFSQFMQGEILSPLGMNHSTFHWDQQVQKKIAKGYNLFAWPHDDRYFTEEAAAGLYTTVEDMANFVLASIYGTDENQLLSNDSLQLMYTPEKIGDTPTGYGLGHNVFSMLNGNTVITHNGMNIGWNSQYFVIPDRGEGIVILTNSEVGNLIISYIFSKWSEWQTGEVSTFYTKRQMINEIYTIAAFILSVILLIRVVFFIKKIKTRKRKFGLHVNNKQYLIILFKLIAPILFALAWWFLLYYPWYEGGWTAATVLPYEVIRVTYAVSAWCCYFALKALFVKEAILLKFDFKGDCL
ncbi:serine hydrolase domain-containing protein [Paenibacillus sp. M1]|uniref:Serine hydrolase domain-containing protein n=1 Tax=Paenibacillus haidiansis TaxID=1574488 RepID=A0ABU7VSE5_9BACL